MTCPGIETSPYVTFVRPFPLPAWTGGRIHPLNCSWCHLICKHGRINVSLRAWVRIRCAAPYHPLAQPNHCPFPAILSTVSRAVGMGWMSGSFRHLISWKIESTNSERGLLPVEQLHRELSASTVGLFISLKTTSKACYWRNATRVKFPFWNDIGIEVPS